MLSNKGPVYPKMHQMQPFEGNMFKIFPGNPPGMQILWPLLTITIASLPTTQKHFDWAAPSCFTIIDSARDSYGIVLN